MRVVTYFNENDPFPAAWLVNLYPGATVDARSVADVRPGDVAGHARAHFFAGIGGWEHALSLAGWPDDAPVWTGSCPCQPFSQAGRKRGEQDERHLWPEWLRLIRECSPSGRRICALRASARRTSGSASTGWPSPTANNAKGSAYSYGSGQRDKPRLKLVGAARLAGWATPAAKEAGGTAKQFLNRKRKAAAAGARLGISLTSLNLQAQGAGWPTPQARDGSKRRGQAKRNFRPRSPSNLDDRVELVRGQRSSGSLAQTAPSGQLNPAFSRWLMGYPDAWDACAPTATRSSRSKRQPSSKQRSKP